MGDRVVTRFASTGTHRGEFAGISPTGREVAIQEVAKKPLQALHDANDPTSDARLDSDNL